MYNNQLVAEAVFVDNYIDSVENLPDEIVRYMSRIRAIDIEYRGHLREVDHYYDSFKSLGNSNEPNASMRKMRFMSRINRSLIQAQELGDEKMQIVQLLTEIIEHKTRQLDADQKNIDIKDELQQQQQQRLDQQQHHHHQQTSIDDLNAGGVSTPKRIQSPAPAHTLANGNGSAGGSSAGGGGGSSPNSERSGGNGSNRLSTVNGNGVGSAAFTTIETNRTAMKRSRRRNESVANSGPNIGGNIELGGNESNSANETGNSNNERKNSNLNLVQKRTISQSQSNSALSGNNAGGSSGLGISASGNSTGNNLGKKKKRRARGAGASQSSNSAAARDDTPPPEPIDPDEPTYCVCNQISFGEMILCDNDLCPIEWFHFSCVSLVLKPKGKWFCPNCRGDRPNVMKPKSQFLKELERYNKEKEEKT